MSNVRRSLLTAAIALVAVVAAPAGAGANDLFTLDPEAESPGKLAVDASGTAHITWVRDTGGPVGSAGAMYCRVPQGASGCAPLLQLPLPVAAVSGNPDPSGLFPVFGPGGALYAVGPRYIEDDTALWKSPDAGASFGAGFPVLNGYSNKTNPATVVFNGSNFLIAAQNPGLGFSVASPGGAGSNFSFANPGTGGVGGASMGLEGAGNPVIAYWNLDDPYPVLYYRFKGAGSLTSEASWEGPLQAASGYEPRLAGGPNGLLMAAQEYPDASSRYPTSLRVRKFTGAGFGPPVTIVDDPTISLFLGGAISQSAGGRVAVVWPGRRTADGARILRLFTSTDGGASFGAQVDVARTGGALAIGDNAQLAITDSGSGWVTYRDENGLHLADLNPIAGPPAPPKAPTKPTGPTKKPKPADYKGKTVVADEKKAGDYDLTLRLPKQCVQPSQRFFAGVGKRKRRGLAKKLGGRIQFTKVVFIFDGKKLKTKEKKPFRYLIDPGPMKAGSTHVVKTRVTALLVKDETEKKIKRTLKGSIKAC